MSKRENSSNPSRMVYHVEMRRDILLQGWVLFVMFGAIGDRDEASLPSKCPIGRKNPPSPEDTYYLRLNRKTPNIMPYSSQGAVGVNL